MITTILSDFSYVLLFPNDKHYSGTLNGLYQTLLGQPKKINIFDYYRLDDNLLNYYQSLKKKYSLNIFTSGSIQNHPQLRAKLEPVFTNILTAADFKLSKSDPIVYRLVAEKLKKKASEILFIDDQEKNIKAAQKAGLNGFVYQNFSALKKYLDLIIK